MGSRVFLLRGLSYSSAMRNSFLTTSRSSCNNFGFPKVTVPHNKVRSCSSTKIQSPPPDVTHLAETARIALTPNEVEEFAPKIQQVIDWFGQLQGVDLESIEPSIRADTENNNVRDDVPETFNDRGTMVASIPSYEEPYIKVPKVLNTE
ncbi:glutamyl-tRNA(Gln) amidotransferase subunit C, chloroplastic/mitochondrial [Prosopis cineraria]|uniref:glutamyl-tRNA(Gln) amidotransferase subunit C, chloroplastic/mitochondrial n=1 Tax=Prosopis cineraria TaxID=364024 RepID=UPI00240F4F57|nr:glutamyl-tRNA(Gln) amidotransferase subunit C, chloroplastic/mitochondrial [Prosopis cineraria]XP_054813266.1 glutamyl-tRNA(Gln) amidotransferase subunit C, chloroplastic/mitochondrial [Prosopis cineraria]XP_054813273.1 glutamyl-tRNA(Gln) amidotransferase subunit C, chloroplastic/mitochondrial [Prosopis cineraria]